MNHDADRQKRKHPCACLKVLQCHERIPERVEAFRTAHLPMCSLAPLFSPIPREEQA